MVTNRAQANRSTTKLSTTKLVQVTHRVKAKLPTNIDWLQDADAEICMAAREVPATDRSLRGQQTEQPMALAACSSSPALRLL